MHSHSVLPRIVLCLYFMYYDFHTFVNKINGIINETCHFGTKPWVSFPTAKWILCISTKSVDALKIINRVRR